MIDYKDHLEKLLNELDELQKQYKHLAALDAVELRNNKGSYDKEYIELVENDINWRRIFAYSVEQIVDMKRAELVEWQDVV